jgi:hypothetical protein
MLAIAFSSLVVIPHNAKAVGHQRQTTISTFGVSDSQSRSRTLGAVVAAACGKFIGTTPEERLAKIIRHSGFTVTRGPGGRIPQRGTIPGGR